MLPFLTKCAILHGCTIFHGAFCQRKGKNSIPCSRLISAADSYSAWIGGQPWPIQGRDRDNTHAGNTMDRRGGIKFKDSGRSQYRQGKIVILLLFCFYSVFMLSRWFHFQNVYGPVRFVLCLLNMLIVCFFSKLLLNQAKQWRHHQLRWTSSDLCIMCSASLSLRNSP